MRHHIQKAILYDLAFSEGMRFNELKPDELDNKLFTYHLKQTISDKLVEKDDAGLYRLTALGRKQGASVLEPDHERVKRARSVIFLLVRQGEKWLLYRRKTHPLINLVGFMHVTPRYEEPILQTASTELKEKTGLDGTFTFAGSGYFHILKNNELESFTHFSLLACEDVSGELRQNDERAEYYWENQPDFTDTVMLPNMALLVAEYTKQKTFFIDKRINL